MRSIIAFCCTLFVAAAQEIPHGIASWDADSLGNHRFVLRVDDAAKFVVARIPWRRRDLDPERKHIFIVDSATGAVITRYLWRSIRREAGQVFFVPASGRGTYYVYYQLYRPRGSRNYPKGYYLPFRVGDESFLPARVPFPPSARVVRYESIDAFNSYWPMELIATPDEMNALSRKYRRADYLVFPESRSNPIRMTANLPAHWAQNGPAERLKATADRGEFLSFQVGVYAMRRGLSDIRVEFSDLRSPAGATIPSSAFSSFNTGGVDWKGRRFTKSIAVDSGRVQALWMGVQVPVAAKPGRYAGTFTVIPKDAPATRVALELTVSDRVMDDAGDGDPSRLSRLRWLDSQLAADDSVVRPFTPLEVRDATISCLGRDVVLTPNGLPAQIHSYFSPENTRLIARGRPLLTEPMRFVMEDARGDRRSWTDGAATFARKNAGIVQWTSRGSLGPFDASLEADMEFDGFLEFRLTLTAREDAQVRDLGLEIPWEPSATRYMMGLGEKGGYRPERVEWKWDQKKNHDAVWVGDVNAGMQLSLRGENYVRPLNTNFYLLKPLAMPPSWFNNGAGGVSIGRSDSKTVLLSATSGARSVRKGEQLHFIWTLLLTPFKLIDTDAQWSTRYYHRLDPLDSVAAAGANTINVHHANAVNPYINYPFLSPDTMRAFAVVAHDRGYRMKIYYTVRELSNRAPELPMLFSLGDEVLAPGDGGGFAWLQEHLDQNYIAAWFVPELKDAAVVNSGVSRWHNFYVEGLDWLVRNIGIDGLYIDDVAFDRTTMKRVRKTLDRHRPNALIDLHSANQYNPRDGFVNSANLYLEHFPYLNRLWFGEYFDYRSAPDFWMVEVSGIPFGLMGEMLENGGNPWRGMVFGMTSRLPWAGDPRPVWKIWDSFGMHGSTMIGYWSPNCPVRTDNPDINVTVFMKKGAALIALASWSRDSVETQLAVDWKALGIDPSRATMSTTASAGFQEARTFMPGAPIPCAPGKGWLIEVKEQSK